MRIGIQTWGSEGDIRPFLALGLGLQRAGHEVEAVVTDLDPKDYCGLGSRIGLRITPVATPVIADPTECDRIGMRLLLAQNFIAQERIMIKHLFDPFIPAMLDEAQRLTQECDLVIGHNYHHPLRMAAEMRAVPEVSVNLYNFGLIPSHHFSPISFPKLGPLFTPLFWRLNKLIFDKLFLASVNRLRAEHRLSPLRDMIGEAWSSRVLNLAAVSKELFTRPPDWDPRHQVCGFLSMPYDSLRPIPTELEVFLSAGPPPVYFGFGSMTANSNHFLRSEAVVLLDTVRDLGCRAIIQIDAAKAGGLPHSADVIWVPSSPHAAVFPRCAAVVHHGGAGTTQSVLIAGVPSVVVPHISDQFLWAEKLHRRGLAPKPLNFRAATAKKLAGRVREVLGSPAMRERAREVRKRVEREDGVGRAVELIEELAINIRKKR
ncbi:MAG: glycosyltransferase [Desulfobacteraceae bacterium]|nr:MAG: glycosyltransferase [Desulfobacteraceae bacterium]